jgi:hypothetical protein
MAYLFGLSQSANVLRILRKCNQVKRGCAGRYPRRFRARIGMKDLILR